MFYFGQILLHHITQNKVKNFSRQITSNLYDVSKILPQARPFETIWSLLERKVYEGTWEAKKFRTIIPKNNFKGKTTRPKLGNKYDLRCSKKTSSNLKKKMFIVFGNIL